MLVLADALDQSFGKLLDVAKLDEAFLHVDVKNTDMFLKEKVTSCQPELWPVVARLLLLSHGQATVERGFSINKEVEVVNMSETTVVAHRAICDHVASVGGIDQVKMTPALLQSCSGARPKYRLFLEAQRKERESREEVKKRKAEEEAKKELVKKRKLLEETIHRLEEDADKHLETAENSTGSKVMAELSKAAALRRAVKEKKQLLNNLS
jgi:hypothetical protein